MENLNLDGISFEEMKTKVDKLRERQAPYTSDYTDKVDQLNRDYNIIHDYLREEGRLSFRWGGSPEAEKTNEEALAKYNRLRRQLIETALQKLQNLQPSSLLRFQDRCEFERYKDYYQMLLHEEQKYIW